MNDSFVVSVDDDMRHCFFQFFVSEENVGLIVWYMIVLIDSVLWLIVVKTPLSHLLAPWAVSRPPHTYRARRADRSATPQQARSTRSPASTVAAGHSTTPDTIDDVGCAAPVKNMGRDSWGLIGTATVTLPNCAWDDDAVPDGDTLCTIDYFIGKQAY